MDDSSEQRGLESSEFDEVRRSVMAFERLFDMSANFESYVDHCQHFPDRTREYARGGRAPSGLDEWFDEPTEDHTTQFGRASMLMNPASAAKAVMQWMQHPELKNGKFLPEHMQIAAHLGQHTVRPVQKNEYLKSEDAMAAYWKEWTNLIGKGVYRDETLCEWHQVRKEALRAGKEVHLAFLFGFMVQKGAEYPDGDPRKKFKYRVVLRGNDIKDQSFEVALFQELSLIHI